MYDNNLKGKISGIILLETFKKQRESLKFHKTQKNIRKYYGNNMQMINYQMTLKDVKNMCT